MHERERPSVQALPVLGQPAAAVQPSSRTLDHPAARQGCEAPRGIRPLDDLHLDLARDLRQPGLELRACVAAISKPCVSTRTRRFLPRTFLPAPRPGGSMQASLCPRPSRPGRRRCRRPGRPRARPARGTARRAHGGRAPTCRPGPSAQSSRGRCCAGPGPRGIARHWQPVPRTCIGPLTTSCVTAVRLLPRRSAGGTKGSTSAHSSPVGSLGQRSPLRS